ncbi:sodium/potassium-transporting ATPase subunit beta-2-like [Sitophilus oryzae]|uniref:Sodium/potassium-transporting ATPase subunit beta-2-like n=1 Tax=Sitophilus oryzae TaxID=7048 RepID=A0A6J2XC08_SITOR|nr:sodium/potassium-transporting ATPase subunit beta-2-like [Sitophilus oryzae]XP_030748691.1 sodium/potassium-transporting ATPase subunit beta-2-like [Sitophilus oryzae]
MADKKPADGQQFYQRPPKLGKWEAFSQFLWNSETKQFMGRTGASWAKILIFYIIFYAVLVGFFAVMLAVFFQTLDIKRPKWELDRSLIGSNPGLGFRPMPSDKNIESTLIWYKHSDKGNVQYWQKEINKFLGVYNKSNNPHADKLEECRQFQLPSPGKVCDVKIDQMWHPCLKDAGYNFESSEGGPCIFLKLNRIFNWNPEYFNSTTIEDPGLKMSEELKREIRDAEAQNKHRIVWVTCEGENVADIEHIGPIRFIPQKGFPSQYFPYTNQDGYISPLVAVYFEKPKRGVLINIECKAWARNIIHDRVDRRGSVHFELMID